MIGGEILRELRHQRIMGQDQRPRLQPRPGRGQHRRIKPLAGLGIIDIDEQQPDRGGVGRKIGHRIGGAADGTKT